MAARGVIMTVEQNGVRIHAASDGPAYILLPVQFSHCLVVVNGAAARLTRASPTTHAAWARKQSGQSPQCAQREHEFAGVQTA